MIPLIYWDRPFSQTSAAGVQDVIKIWSKLMALSIHNRWRADDVWQQAEDVNGPQFSRDQCKALMCRVRKET